MRKLLSKLWEDDGGFIISLELLFIAVILVIGIIAGLASASASCTTLTGAPTTSTATGKSTSTIISMADITCRTCTRG